MATVNLSFTEVRTDIVDCLVAFDAANECFTLKSNVRQSAESSKSHSFAMFPGFALSKRPSPTSSAVQTPDLQAVTQAFYFP